MAVSLAILTQFDGWRRVTEEALIHFRLWSHRRRRRRRRTRRRRRRRKEEEEERGEVVEVSLAILSQFVNEFVSKWIEIVNYFSWSFIYPVGWPFLLRHLDSSIAVPFRVVQYEFPLREPLWLILRPYARICWY